MANERLYQFPSKASPVPADILFTGNSADSFNEVQITIAGLIAAYPNLIGIAGLSLTANTFPYVDNTSAFAAASISALGVTLLANTTASGMRTTLGVAIGTDVEAHSAALDSIAGLTTVANNLIYTTALNTYAVIAPVNSAVLITSAGGVPSESQTLPSAVQANITALGAQAQALNMNSHLINNVTDPVSAQDAATKNYVDTIATGITVQGACYAATTATLNATYSNGASGFGATLTNAGALIAFAVDGVSPALNARILVKNQSSPAQNGIYTLTTIGSGVVAWILTRATDYDQASEINPGDLVVLTAGSTQANSSWLQTATVTIIGTDAVSFSQFTASLPVNVPSGGTGLTTTTAYGLITGGTTATGNFQNAGTGTSGQIYVSSGASSLGTWTSSPTFTAPTLGAALATSLNFGASATNGIIGVTGGTSAASGVVGEVISSNNIGTGVSLTSSMVANVNSVSLSAGEWDLFGNIIFVPGGATTYSQFAAAITTSSASIPNPSLSDSVIQFNSTGFTAGSNQFFSLASCVISIASTTTVYMTAQSTFGISTLKAGAVLIGRRRR